MTDELELELELDWGNRKPRGPDQATDPLPEQKQPEDNPLGVRISGIEGAGVQRDTRSKGLPPGHPNAMPEGLLFRVGRFFSERSLRINQAFEAEKTTRTSSPPRSRATAWSARSAATSTPSIGTPPTA